MHDDEKMFNIGLIMLALMVIITGFLQVCYRVQNKNLNQIRREMDDIRHEYDMAKTKFSTLSSADSLRGSIIGINPKAEIVSFSKTVNVDNIPMVGE